MKIGIIGAGAVGSACLTACVQRRVAHEIVVVNRDRKKARGLVTDVQYGAVLFPGTEIRDGDYADLRGASLVVTDPPDPLADAVRKLGHDRVLSTGTYLDSLRFKFHLGRGLNVDPASVDAQILGEHGTSAVFMWSSATIGARPVRECLSQSSSQSWDEFRRDIEQAVRFANIAIIEGIGASQHGIGIVSARIAEMILRDERTVIPIGSYQPQYDITLSLPSVLGRSGVAQILEPAMSANDREGLRRSAETLKAAVARIKI